MIPLLVVVEINSIVTVLQHVFGHPLGVITSALCCNTCYLSILIAKVNLHPLIHIVASSAPAACFAWIVLKVKSALDSSMVRIVFC